MRSEELREKLDELFQQHGNVLKVRLLVIERPEN
jgi:hypothetical protein